MSPQNSFTQDRRSFIGGSDARIIMGTDETALLRLWKEKRGQVAPEDLSGNLIVQLGVATEALIRHWYELLEAGNAKAMALLTSERSPLFPTLQTSKEQGLPGIDSYFWTAFFFPKDTPDAIVQKLYDATNQTLKSPTTVDRLKRAGVAPIAPALRTPEYLRTFIGTEVDNWAATIKASGISIE